MEAAERGQTSADADIDIDLSDPAVKKAALRLEAAFRGFKSPHKFTRKVGPSPLVQ